jgi:hypothetical protein
MRRGLERSAKGAIAPLAVLVTISVIGPAGAAGLPPATDGVTRAPQCSEAAEGCARIRGHIPATSERAGVETLGGRPAGFGPPSAPFVSGFSAAGQAAADAVSRGLFFLQVSHDETAR